MTANIHLKTTRNKNPTKSSMTITISKTSALSSYDYHESVYILKKPVCRTHNSGDVFKSKKTKKSLKKVKENKSIKKILKMIKKQKNKKDKTKKNIKD